MKKLLFFVFGFFGLGLLLFLFGIIWKSPPYFKIKSYQKLEVPIMEMKAYKEIWQTHRRPYNYRIKSEREAEVYVLGVEHINDPNHHIGFQCLKVIDHVVHYFLNGGLMEELEWMLGLDLKENI